MAGHISGIEDNQCAIRTGTDEIIRLQEHIQWISWTVKFSTLLILTG